MKRKGTIKIFHGRNGDYRWHLKSSNGQIVLQGEGHSSVTKCLRAIRTAEELFDNNYVLELPKRPRHHQVAALTTKRTGRPKKRKGRGPDRKPRKRRSGQLTLQPLKV